MTRVRRFFPPAGRPYELFDCSVLLLVLMVFNYILSEPSHTQEIALKGPFRVLAPELWGSGMALCAAYGVFASFRPRLVTSGYVVTIAASIFWCALFAASLLFINLPDWRVFATIVLYGWIARRLIREEDRGYEAGEALRNLHCPETDADL